MPGTRYPPLHGGVMIGRRFAACDDPAALQEICDRLQPGTIEVFAQRWLHRYLPLDGKVEVCTTYDGTVVKTVIRLTRRGRR